MVLLDDEMHIYEWNLTTNITVTWTLAGLNPAYDVRISLPLYFLPTSITPLQTIISGDHPHPNHPAPRPRLAFTYRMPQPHRNPHHKPNHPRK